MLRFGGQNEKKGNENMKKTSLIVVTLILTLILSTGTVFADTSSQTVNLVLGQSTAQINGQTVTMTAPAQVVSGRTLVPLRFISEAFGCDVAWDGTTKTATVTLVDQVIEVPIGQNYVVINGVQTDVEVPGQLINGSTFVPLRFIGENLGAKVDYDSATKGISILMNTFQSKPIGFSMVLPTGWTVNAEDETGVSLSNGGDGNALFLSVEKEAGVNTASDIDTDELFKDYTAKDQFSITTYDNAVVASYQENSTWYVIEYVFIGSKVYGISFDAPVDSFDDAFAAQCDLMVNTMETYTAQ